MDVKKNTFTKPWNDPDDAPELTEFFFSKGQKMIGNNEVSTHDFQKAVKNLHLERPKAVNPKKAISIRLSSDVLSYFKSTGKGWQTKMNEVLQQYVTIQKQS